MSTYRIVIELKVYNKSGQLKTPRMVWYQDAPDEYTARVLCFKKLEAFPERIIETKIIEIISKE